MYNAYGKEWIKAGFDENTGGYAVYHKKHNIKGNKHWKVELSPSNILSNYSYREELGDESSRGTSIRIEGGYINGKKFDIKAIEAQTSGKIRDSIRDAEKKADLVIFNAIGISDMDFIEWGVARWNGLNKRKIDVWVLTDNDIIKHKKD